MCIRESQGGGAEEGGGRRGRQGQCRQQGGHEGG